MTCREREAVILRAHEAGAYDAAAADYFVHFVHYDFCTRKEYEAKCLAITLDLFADGWLSRRRWRRSLRHLLEAGVQPGWQNKVTGERYPAPHRYSSDVWK